MAKKMRVAVRSRASTEQKAMFSIGSKEEAVGAGLLEKNVHRLPLDRKRCPESPIILMGSVNTVAILVVK